MPSMLEQRGIRETFNPDGKEDDMTASTEIRENERVVNIGIGEQERREIAEGLARFLADKYTLYLKTHNFHWNVTGPMFETLHTMFEAQYRELAEAVDQIAERIRALGFPAPGTYAQFGNLASIKEEPGVPGAETMIQRLLDGHETAVRTARSLLPAVERAHDEPTLNVVSDRMQAHEKTAWMLRSMLMR